MTTPRPLPDILQATTDLITTTMIEVANILDDLIATLKEIGTDDDQR